MYVPTVIARAAWRAAEDEGPGWPFVVDGGLPAVYGGFIGGKVIFVTFSPADGPADWDGPDDPLGRRDR